MMQLEDWLDDLCVRFVVNIPAEELVSLERICFQIEEAQWFYEDFIRPLDPSLPSLSLKPFFQRIVPRCPTLQAWPQDDMATAFERFLKYKNRVPVRGAILLSDKMDEVLLVKGWKKNGTWSFPRGKINKDEDDLDCAVREAWEETGFDIRAAGLIRDPNKVKFIEKTMRSQNMKLFVFRGVPRDAHFVPQTRKEISKIEWFRLADLPTEKKRTQHEGTGQHLVLNANKFYVVAPFMHDLKKIINAERRKDNRQSSKLAAPPMTFDPMTGEVHDYQPQILQNVGPLSPAIPSSLPEVNTAMGPDVLQHLKQHLNISPPDHVQPVDTNAKSNALLALLRNGPPVEMREDPHTPLEQTAFTTQPQSPERPVQQPPMMDIRSPPPLFDLHQEMHPAAPSSSSLPQLSQHTRSLLDAFKLPGLPQSPPLQQRTNLPASKQNLLAAFTSPPASQVSAIVSPPPIENQGQNLLQLLQRNNSVPDSLPQAPHSSQIFDAQAIQPSNVISPPPQMMHSTSQPLPALASNSLLNLLQTKQNSNGSAQPLSVATNVTAGPGPSSGKSRLPSLTQTEPAELSANSDHEAKTQSANKTKADLLSLLNTKPTNVQRRTEPKSRSGTTSANLDRPIDQPQFDAIRASATPEDDMRREPVTGERKLFDHKTGSVKQITPIKVSSRTDDRGRQPKSPRNFRHKQTHSPRRPATPKEAAKPFQPQILKRPQASDADDKTAPLSLPVAENLARKEPSPAISQASSFAQGPLSPSTEAPQAIEAIRHTEIPAPQRQVSQPLLSPIHDPQREALLSLLKTPTQKNAMTEPDATPKASYAFSPEAQPRPDGISTPPGANQLVSPVIEEGFEPSAPRSRVSSLASINNVIVGATRPTIEKRQTAAGDKAFLLQYLKGFANQETAPG